MCSHILGHLWPPGPQVHTAYQTTSQTAVTGSAHFRRAPGTQGLLPHTRLSVLQMHSHVQAERREQGDPLLATARMTEQGRDTALMEYYTAVRMMPLQQPLREPCGITLTSACRGSLCTLQDIQSSTTPSGLARKLPKQPSAVERDPEDTAQPGEGRVCLEATGSGPPQGAQPIRLWKKDSKSVRLRFCTGCKLVFAGRSRNPG